MYCGRLIRATEYVEITPFDPWHTKVLLAAMKHIQPDAENVAAPPELPEASSSGTNMSVAEFLGEDSTAVAPAVPKTGTDTGSTGPTAANLAEPLGSDSESDDDDDGAFT